MINEIFEKLISEDFNENLQIGDRVIVRSNEPDPLMFAEYLGEQEIGRGGSKIPLVRSEKDGKEYLAMGIVRKYSEELVAELEGMSSKEQWNHLCHPWMRKE